MTLYLRSNTYTEGSETPIKYDKLRKGEKKNYRWELKIEVKVVCRTSIRL